MWLGLARVDMVAVWKLGRPKGHTKKISLNPNIRRVQGCRKWTIDGIANLFVRVAEEVRKKSSLDKKHLERFDS